MDGISQVLINQIFPRCCFYGLWLNKSNHRGKQKRQKSKDKKDKKRQKTNVHAAGHFEYELHLFSQDQRLK